MVYTVAAWLENEDRSGASQPLAAVADEQFTTNGDNLRLRNDSPYPELMYLWTNTASYLPITAEVSSSSIANNPIQLSRGFGLNFVNSDKIIYDFRRNGFANPDGTPRIQPGEDVTVSGYEEFN